MSRWFKDNSQSMRRISRPQFSRVIDSEAVTVSVSIQLGSAVKITALKQEAKV